MHTTTVRIPGPTYDFAREVLESGETEATTLNNLMVSSLEIRLKEIKEARIDARLARMADDETYQTAAVQLYELYDANASENLPGRTLKLRDSARAEMAHVERLAAFNE